MMRKLVLLLCLFLLRMTASAQSIIQKVNDIKLSDEYIWEQYASPSADTALVKAAEWLLANVSAEMVHDISGQDMLPYTKHIFLKGEKVTRAFVYMKKSDVKAAIEGIRAVRGKKAGEATPVDELASELMALKDLYAVSAYMEQGKSSGGILHYGSPKQTDTMDDKHLVLFAKDNLKPICVLSPVSDGGRRTNLTSGAADSLDNHHGCYAIWYIPR